MAAWNGKKGHDFLSNEVEIHFQLEYAFKWRWPASVISFEYKSRRIHKVHNEQ